MARSRWTKKDIREVIELAAVFVLIGGISGFLYGGIGTALARLRRGSEIAAPMLKVQKRPRNRNVRHMISIICLLGAQA